MINLPDFEDMIELANDVGSKQTELSICKNELDFLLGQITVKVNTDEKFFDNGKPPSNVHVKDTYHKLGTNEAEQLEIKKLRGRIAELDGELKAKQAILKIYQDMVGVWRTQSANERGAFLE